MEKKKLIYLDGLRGLGCAMVFLTHFVFAFYYGMYHFQPESCHLPGNLDIVIGKSPLNLIFNGSSAVRLFLVMSGYLLCRNYMISGDKEHLKQSAKKRYLRLMPPVLVTNLAIYLCMKLGLYCNWEAAELAGSTEWYQTFNAFPADFWDMLKESLVGCYLFGTNDYNGVLWTMQVLFLGAYLAYALVLFVRPLKYRYIIYAILTVLLLRTDFIGVLLGYILCDFMYSDFPKFHAFLSQKWLNWILFFVGLYFCGFPSSGFGYEGTIWEILMPYIFVNYYHIFGVLCFVFAVFHLEPLQKFFSMKVFRYIGRISYSMYLIHFLVMATFSAWFLLTFHDLLGYNLTSLLNFILTAGITVLLSELSLRYVEPLSKKGEVLLGRIFTK
ncbi:MAG: acyltransferase [Lachnospiraceae bacterium]|nr:acyltransferase [Lachnospiraceae bacterium]